MKNQIQFYVDSNKLLCDFQSGFRSGHGTNTAMLKVTNDLATSIDNNQMSLLTSLDLKKTFDLVNHEKLLTKLHVKFNFSPFACNLLKSYLSNRWQRVCVGNLRSELVAVTSGTPQGGILSALLFSLFINDLGEVVETNFHLYADDSQLYCSSPINDVPQCVSNMNKSLKNVCDWAEENSLIINPSKSKAILISKKKITSAPPVVIGTETIEYCETVNILGLCIDNELSWKFHIAKMCREIYGCLGMLKQTQNVTPQLTRKRLVQALIMAKFMYLSNIYMSCSRALWNQITLCFNSCLRYIFGLKKFDSISPYRDELLGCSIENFVKFRACLFMFNLLRHKSPLYLYNEINFPRRPRNGRIVATKCRNCQESKSYFVYCVHLWNSLSSDIRCLDSVSAFKQECLSYLALERA